MPPLAGWTLWITGFVGKSPALDDIMSLLVSDFFIPVSVSLILLGLWLVQRDRARRDHQQRTIMFTAVGIGIANAVIQLVNRIHFWPRPFLVDDIVISESARRAAETVFYLPHDPSFPSNAAAMAFAAATGVWLGNRKAGAVLYAMAAIYAFARFYAGVHFFLDVVAGAIIGSVVSYVICKFCMPRTEPWPTLMLNLGRFLYIA